MADELKTARAKLKGQVTRSVNSLKRFRSEDDEGKVKAELEKLKQRYEAFEAAHDRYHDTLQSEEDWAQSDDYLYAVQDNYISALDEAKVWLKRQRGDDDVKPAPTDEGTRGVSVDVLNMMYQPKMEIEKFNGDPTKFHIFMTTFDEVVHKVSQDDRVKLARLIDSCEGEAKKAIQGCILIKREDCYKKARDILRKRFGDDHLVVERLISDLRLGEPVRSAKALQQLADDLDCCHMTLSQMGYLQEVESQTYIVEIVNRLVPYLQIKWKKRALEEKNSSEKYPDFKMLVDFVIKEASDANDPVYGKMGQRSSSRGSDKKPVASFSKQSTNFSSSVNDSTQKWKRPACILCKSDHKLLYCSKFKEMKLGERLKYVKDRNLCENCLLNNHVTEQCRKPSVCDVNGCGKKHTRYIHVEEPSSSEKKENDKRGKHAHVNNVNVEPDVHMPIVELKVNDAYNACALLDTASSSSFCSRELVEKLKVEGKSVKYFLNTMSTSEERSSEVVSLRVSTLNGSEHLELSHVYVVDNIPVQLPQMKLRSYAHLKDLPLSRSSDKVEILIGQDNSEALIPLEVRRGDKHEPFAVKTLFGWSLNGPAKIPNSVGKRVISHFICGTSLEEKVNSLWNIENEGICGEVDSFSQNDKRVIQLWDQECRKVDGHYELPIPWKSDLTLPSNLSLALSRLKSLENSLDKRDLRMCYDQEMKLLLSKDYAEAVPPAEVVNPAAKRIWYLPHQAVVSDKKPGKTRIVFDCAAKFRDVSLNSSCLQGPDLNNKLVNVLLRFRQHPYAVMADIESMYHQVLVPVNDRDALRFLWFNDSGDICHFRMTRHLFGGVWCASSATYALRKVLEEDPGIDPIIFDTILRSFYVDDCLKSVASREDAEAVIHGTQTVLSKAGFNLTKFIANDSQLLNAIPEGQRSKEAKDFSSGCKSKALGVKWNVENDTLYFDVSLASKLSVTKRQMLSFVASNFDPLGLVSPVVVIGKLLFQEATRLKLPWDGEVPYDLKQKWVKWIQCLQWMTKFNVPRCIKPMGFEDAYLEIHNFSDASEKAYGCCSYLRCINQNGEISVNLILSKSKVAPLKQISTPRLELQAAVLAVRVDRMLRSELDLKLGPSFFWVDSEIVIKYIRNDEKRFKVFVGTRVGEIREVTSPSQWNHIAGKDNIADCTSRGQSLESLDIEKWISGPSFLKKYKSEWNLVAVDEQIPETDPEVKKSVVFANSVECHVSDVVSDTFHQLFDHYSSWYKLKRAVAWLTRFKQYLMLKSPKNGLNKSISVNDLLFAERDILKFAQSRSYQGELKSMSSGEGVNKTSSVRFLDPFLDSDGLIRVGGRIGSANLGVSQKYPILVPHDHPVALLLVRECHNYAHVGTEWVVSQLRQRYWITRIRRVVKSISRSCFKCREYFGRPCAQKMANLPSERLESGHPPFYYVGIDCFGPFLVKQGRSNVKRYGCIFTCLNTRAVHLEKLHNLDVDSFLNGFRRFVCRRGNPSKVWTDNGTNFVGGEAEMTRCFNELQAKAIESNGVAQNIAWHFNPPSASHFGGIWERMIRTVRKVMIGIAGFHVKLDDESLGTLFCEVEQMINSRPITKVSNDVNDPSVLTPNHLLLLREQPSISPGNFSEQDIYKRRWRCVQHLAQVYWRRWLAEYIPDLQRRSKWLNVHVNVEVGDVVLIMNENTPRGVWPMGIITEVYVSSDGLVRSAKIRTKAAELVRPIVKLVKIEESDA